MWDQRCARGAFLFGTEPAAALRQHASRFFKRSKCLCVADGEGRNSVWLAEQGHEVTAWDASTVAIEKAKGHADVRDATIDFGIQDAANYDWSPKQYDVVVAIFIQFAVPDFRESIFAGMKQATRPGGLILLHGYTPEQIAFDTDGPPCAENLYTEEMLLAGFDDFEILHLNCYISHIQEGSGHSGKSALIDLIAKKPKYRPMISGCSSIYST